MNAYISKIYRNYKEKLNEMNNRILTINKEITKIKDDMAQTQELNRATINTHQILLNNIYETVYPKFFANLTVEKFRKRRISRKKKKT